MLEEKESLVKIAVSVVLSLVIVLAVTSTLAYFFFMKDNRRDVEVFIDSKGKIYINGSVSTESNATSMVNDPAYKVTIRYHPDSPIHYCFGQCM